MSRLSQRLAITWLAAGLVGASLIDVGLLLWAQRHATADAQGLQTLAAAELAARLGSGEPVRLVQELAQRYGCLVAVRDPSGAVIQSDPGATLPVAPPGRHVLGGMDYWVAAAPGGGQLIIGRPLSATLNQTLALQGPLLLLLSSSLLLTAGLGTWFLRRGLLRPLRSLGELVGRQDLDALAKLDTGSTDEVAQLGHAIAAMSGRLEADRRRIAEQLAALTLAHQKLEQAQGQLLRAERLAVAGQLAAGVAHEIGNPLGVLSGYLDMLRGGSLTGPELEGALGRMQKEVERVNAIVRDLLGFARPKVPSGPGDVAEALAHVRALVAPQSRFKHLRLSWPEAAAPLPVPLGTDALTQLLLNLLLNAADAVGASGDIRVTVEPGADAVVLRVEDSGPGVPPELRQKIFAPFFTTKGARPEGERLAGGTGLGLSVCEGLVSAVGGDLYVEDGRLGGAAFVVRLPAPTAAGR